MDMRRGRVGVALVASLLVCGALTSAWSGDVTGTYRVRLKKSVTPALRGETRLHAIDSLRYRLKLWLDENMLDPPDLGNPVTRYFLKGFGDSCVARAKETSAVEEREWVYGLTVSESDIRTFIAKSNSHYDSLTRHYWKIAAEGIKFQRLPVIYSACVYALYYAAGHIQLLGAPVNEGRLEAIRMAQTELQSVLNTIAVEFSESILKGKPGDPIENNITVKAVCFTSREVTEKPNPDQDTDQSGKAPATRVVYDSVPFAGLSITGRLPDGTKVLTLRTGPDGTASVGKIKMPFVAHGTFLHTITDFGSLVDPNLSFSPKDFGLRVPEGHDQSLMFNLVKPVYVLEYRVTAANEMEIPEDFGGKVGMEKFLQDSCHMVPKKGTMPADYLVDLKCQVSSYESDEDEMTRLKVEAQATVKQLRTGGASVEKTKVIHERSYETGMSVPTGLFFWESTIALHVFLRELLGQI